MDQRGTLFADELSLMHGSPATAFPGAVAAPESEASSEQGEKSPPKSLGEMLDRFEETADEHEKVSMDNIMDAVGRRSFGPLLLLAAVVVSAPGVGDIPGVPTILGIFILIIVVQLLMNRDYFWLPQWMLKREVSSERVRKMSTSKWVRKPAKFIDHLLKERLTALTGAGGTRAIAIACVVMCLAMPFTEVVPLSTTGLGLGLLAFGLSLVARDGLMALAGFIISGVTGVLLVMGFT